MPATSHSGRPLAAISIPGGQATLEQFLSSAPKPAKGWTAVHFDLAHFGMINQVLGRRVGDKILAQVGRTLQREATFCWFHLGGDAWVGISERRPLSMVQHQLDQLRAAIRRDALELIGTDVRFDAYFGLAGGRNIRLATEQAEFACSEARRTATRFVSFEDLGGVDTDNGFISRYIMGEPVNQLVQLHRQAILYPGHGQHFEVLSRHQGASMAKELMLMERLGLAVEFDLAIVREALAIIPDEAPRHTINLSNLTVRDSLALVELIGLLRGRTNIAIEVTETAAIEDITQVARAVEMFRAAGIDVYLDDFGEGAASLSMLALPWSAVKLSRTICGYDCAGDVLASVIRLAKARSMQVIAECIETEAHQLRLAEMGVDGFQGYLFHRPEPIELPAAAGELKRCLND